MEAAIVVLQFHAPEVAFQRTEAEQVAAAVLAKARAAVDALQKQPAQQELAIHLRASLRGLERALSQ